MFLKYKICAANFNDDENGEKYPEDTFHLNNNIFWEFLLFDIGLL